MQPTPLPFTMRSRHRRREGSAARGWLPVDLPGFDLKVLRAAVQELVGQVPERVIGPA